MLTPLASPAVPVTIAIDQWQTTDGNFGFSALHSATSSGITYDGGLFLRSGTIDYQVNPNGLLSADLMGDVLDIQLGTVQLNGAGTL